MITQKRKIISADFIMEFETWLSESYRKTLQHSLFFAWLSQKETIGVLFDDRQHWVRNEGDFGVILAKY